MAHQTDPFSPDVSVWPGFNDTLATGAARFAPATRAQLLASVLTLWNILDANINTAQRANNGYRGRWGTPYGYMRPVQLQAYLRAVWRRPNVRTYCEVGVNGGHGTAAMLLANPGMVAHSFDLGAYGYSSQAYTILSLHFGERFNLHRGDSTVVLPAWSAANRNVSCDVILVDGDHSARGAYTDLVNMRELAGCNATVLIDDVTMPPGEALRQAEQRGLVGDVDRRVYPRQTWGNPCLRGREPGRVRRRCPREWGWATARYVRPARCAREQWTSPR